MYKKRYFIVAIINADNKKHSIIKCYVIFIAMFLHIVFYILTFPIHILIVIIFMKAVILACLNKFTYFLTQSIKIMSYNFFESNLIVLALSYLTSTKILNSLSGRKRYILTIVTLLTN